MAVVIPGVLGRGDPVGEPAPLVFDSPHSGALYPKDFDTIAPMAGLRSAGDAYVEELFGAAPAQGATLLYALFPRSYIDPNRHPLDIDEALLAEPWPEPLRPTDNTKERR